MMETEESRVLHYNYLVSADGFNSIEFDDAYARVKNNFNPINSTEIKKAIEIWMKESDKYTDINNKLYKKYKIAILENILTSCYLIDEYNKDDVADLLKDIDPKNKVLYFYNNNKNRSNKPPVLPLSYASIPTDIIIPEGYKTLFNSGNSSEELISRINKVNYPIEWDNSPIIELSNLKYQLSLLRDQKDLFLKYQNFLMDEILWYILTINQKSKSLPSKARKEIAPFITFAEKINTELIDNKVYEKSDYRNLKLMKVREYISKNYKLNDFYVFIPNMDAAIDSYFERKNLVQSNALKDALAINSIVQLRKFAYDNYYEDVRKEKEELVDEFLEGKSKLAFQKDDIYYEFKNSKKTLTEIENKRSLSDEEYSNYARLINLLLFRLN